MYKKILVPLDGSGRAEAILPHVQTLASCFGSTVIFVQVIEPGPVLVDPHESHVRAYLDDMARRIEEARGYLTSRRGEFRGMGITAEIRVVEGPIAEGIISVAETEDVDLIAMASHGRTGLARVFYGSVAAGVLHRVDRPLLLIRSRRDAPGE